MNTFGELLRLTTFGESHGPTMGAVIDGCPAGVPLSTAQIQAALDRRRPGQSSVTTARQEADQVELLSGVYEGKTLGTPIAAVGPQRRRPLEGLREPEGSSRPRGRGLARALQAPRSSGRGTDERTRDAQSGDRRAVAEALLARELPELRLVAWVAQVGPVVAPAMTPSRIQVDAHPTRCPDAASAVRIEQLILEAKSAGDSLGGIVEARVEGLPIGLGEPCSES